MSAATSAPSRFRGLDGLRAIAALAIFFHHVGFWSGATFTGFWGNYLGRMDIGVPVFFSLSGFLMFRPIAASVLDDRPLRPVLDHLWRRALRIYPAFWVALFLIVVFTSEAFQDVTGAIVTILLVHIHWPTHTIGPMPQSWSLATEVSFYAVLPLLARGVRPVLAGRPRDQRRNGLLLVAAGLYALSVAFRVLVLGLDNRWTGSAVLWLPAMFDFFAIGMSLAILHVGLEPGTPGRERLERWAAPAGLWWAGAFVAFTVVSQWMGLALGLETASWPREIARQFMYGLIGLLLLLPLVFGGARRSRVRRFVQSGPAEWLGTISYSIYLWHMVFIVHAWQPLDRFVDRVWNRTVRADWFDSLLGWSGLVDVLDQRFFTLCVVAGLPTFVVSVISYYVVERRGQALQPLVRRPVVDPTPSEERIGRLVTRWRTASYRGQLAVIAVGAGALRVAYVVFAKWNETLDGNGDVFPGDQFYYSLAGDALADGRGFVVPWHDPILIPAGLAEAGSAAPPAADHPPLTALFATPAAVLPGDPLSLAHLRGQRLTMCLVGVAAVVVIGLLGRAIAGRTVGLVSAGVAAVYPGFWVNDGLIMAEALTTLMVAGALWAAVRYRRSPSVRGVAEIGVWIGLASLARSESLLLAPLVVAPLVWVAHEQMAKRVTRLAVAGAAVVVVISPWVVPNLVRFEEPVLMSTNDGTTLVGANNPDTYAGDAIGFWTLNATTAIDDDGLDQSEVSRVLRDEAVEFVGDNLSDLPAVVTARLGRVWSVYRPLQMADWNTGEGREIWASNLAIVGFFGLVPLAALGWWTVRRESVPTWTLTATIVHVSVVAALFYGIPRFRVTAEIALVVWAAVGLCAMSSLATCRHRITPSPSEPTSSLPPSSS